MTHPTDRNWESEFVKIFESKNLGQFLEAHEYEDFINKLLAFIQKEKEASNEEGRNNRREECNQHSKDAYQRGVKDVISMMRKYMTPTKNSSVFTEMARKVVVEIIDEIEKRLL